MSAEDLRRELIGMLPRLRRFAFALTGNRHDGDDLLQATAERLLDKGMPPGAAPDRWMFRVCRNLWIDEIRSRSTRSAVPLEDTREPAQEIDGERVAMGKMTLEEVSRALAILPEEQRAALLLVVLEGCTYAEAAGILGTPVGTIMSRIARARGALAAQMRGEPAQPGAGVRG